MKLVRFGPKGKEKPGLWKDGKRIHFRTSNGARILNKFYINE
jgi:hypothetical protein